MKSLNLKTAKTIIFLILSSGAMYCIIECVKRYSNL